MSKGTPAYEQDEGHEADLDNDDTSTPLEVPCMCKELCDCFMVALLVSCCLHDNHDCWGFHYIQAVAVPVPWHKGCKHRTETTYLLA